MSPISKLSRRKINIIYLIIYELREKNDRDENKK